MLTFHVQALELQQLILQQLIPQQLIAKGSANELGEKHRSIAESNMGEANFVSM